MRLETLLAGIDNQHIHGDFNRDIHKLTYDSRKVEQNDMFIAIKGFNFDGHDFIQNAVTRGARSIVYENDTQLPDAVTGIQVSDSRKTLSLLAQNFFDKPSHNMNIVGITGTNGKTSVSYIIDSILKCSNAETGITGTIAYKVGKTIIPAQQTTPESVELQSYLHEMKLQNVEWVIMEISSHALVLDRLYGTKFDYVVFTNLSRDHLDFHKNVENYFNAKLKLFTEMNTSKTYAIINADDDYSAEIIKQTTAQIVTYGINKKADLHAKDIKLSDKGTELTVDTPIGEITFCLPLLGECNVYNALAGLGVGIAAGLEKESLIMGIETLQSVPGRFEKIQCNQNFTVLVDYAHTPDALKKLLETVGKIANGNIITVFGCGGDRDKGKRPLMGHVAETLSDVVIVTSDNPRTENPARIITDIDQGITDKSKLKVIPDRKKAIEHALSNAGENDFVVIAGKGHEDYQIIGNQKNHFDDHEVVQSILA